MLTPTWKRGRVDYRTRLESVSPGNRTQGSNPCVSAEGWQSGLSHAVANRESREGPWVRIPLLPPEADVGTGSRLGLKPWVFVGSNPTVRTIFAPEVHPGERTVGIREEGGSNPLEGSMGL